MNGDHVSVLISNYTLLANVEAASIDQPGAGNLTGNALNNYLGASAGNNVFDGGDGHDTVDYQWGNNGSGVTVSLAVSGPQNTGGSGSDTLSNIEQLRGSEYNDSSPAMPRTTGWKAGAATTCSRAAAGMTISMVASATTR